MTQVVADSAAPLTAAPPVRRGTGWPGRLLAVGLPTGLFGMHALLYGRWIVDDAGITFAYARSVATGAGPVLQPGGEVVEGYSNPAWLALLAVGRWLGLFDRGAWFGVPDYVAFPKVLALVLVAGMFACFLVIATSVSSRPVLVTVVAGSVTAAVPSFVIWTMSGLENSLLACTAVAIAAVLVKAVEADRLLATSTAVRCGLLAALAALTRPDGLIYLGAFPLAALLLLRRGDLGRAVVAAAASGIAFAVPAGAYLGWRLATFGEYLPNTAIAKAQGVPGHAALVRPGELVGYLGWLSVLLAVGCVGAALARPWPGRRGLVVLLVPLTLAVSAFAVLEADWMEQLRFATPVWPLGALVAVSAVTQVIPHLRPRGLAVLAVAAAVAASGSGLAMVDVARTFRAAPTAPLCIVAQNTGYAFNGYARILGRDDASLLAPDIGGAAMGSTLRIVDMAGLAHNRLAHFWGAGDMAGLRDFVFTEARPTFITINPAWSRATGIAADPRIAIDYVEIGTSASQVTDWVRRDVQAPGQLEAMQAYAAASAVLTDTAARQSPRASCGDVIAPAPR